MLSTVKQIVLAHVRRQKIKFNFMYQYPQKAMTMRNQRANRGHLVKGLVAHKAILRKAFFLKKN